MARSMPAPIRGWYVGSPMADAPAGTAFLLENAFPEYDFVRARGGALEFASGMTDPVRALIPFTNGVIAKLFAYAGITIFDATSGGPNPPFAVTGLNGVAEVSYTQYGGTGPQTLVVANGVDPLHFYNGTTWSTTPAWTGDLTTNNEKISFVWQYNHRLYGIAEESMHVYYTAVNAIGGPTTVFPMAPLMRLGGKLVAGGTWTQYTVSGEQYTWFVISSEGEVVVFTGSFPGDDGSTQGGVPGRAWTQQGCYKIGRPLAKNCINTVGGDAAILTEDGIVALSKVMYLDQIALNFTAITQPIAPAFREAVLARAGQPGWQMTLWPGRYMGIICMPQLSGKPNIQFIANARTGFWCRYSGWDARCFAIHGLLEKNLFYGTSDGRIMQAETGGMDDSKAYTATIFYSYNAVGSQDVTATGSLGSQLSGQQQLSASQAISRKLVTMVRTRFQTNMLGLNPAISINTDYDTTVPSLPSPSGTIQAGTNWDTAKWDADSWGGAIFRQTQVWRPVYAMANVVAPIIQVTLKTEATPDVRLTNIDVVFEQGNMFG